MNKIKKLIAIDFDGTLINTDKDDDVLKKEWEDYYQKKYPYIGWWSKSESLDMDVFNYKAYDWLKKYISDNTNDETFIVLLSSRITKLENEVNNVLQINNIFLNNIDLKKDNCDKGTRLEKYFKLFPNLKTIITFDDNIVDTNSYFKLKDRYDKYYDFFIYSANKGRYILLNNNN